MARLIILLVIFFFALQSPEALVGPYNNNNSAATEAKLLAPHATHCALRALGIPCPPLSEHALEYRGDIAVREDVGEDADGD